MSRNLVPSENETQSLGTQLKQWLKIWTKDICISGEISDGVNSVTVADLTGGATSKLCWQFSGSRDSAGSGDRDMETDSVNVGITELIVPVDSQLKYITASSDDPESWEAHVYKNGSSVASLVISGASSGVSTTLSVPFSAGDKVRLRQVNGTGSINQPRIMAFFKEV